MASTRPAFSFVADCNAQNIRLDILGVKNFLPGKIIYFPWEKLYGPSEAAIITPGNSVAKSLGRFLAVSNEKRRACICSITAICGNTSRCMATARFTI